MMCPMYIADRSHRCIEEMAILLRSSPSMPNFPKEILVARICQPPLGLYRSLEPWEPSLEVPIPIFFFFLAMSKSVE